MAQIDGGGLYFKSEFDNDQMNRAIEETMKRIQGLSDATVSGGDVIDESFMSSAKTIREALMQISRALSDNQSEISKLEKKYNELGAKSNEALTAGREDEQRAIEEAKSAIVGEITLRKSLAKELQSLGVELDAQNEKIKESRTRTEQASNVTQSLRGRIRDLREEMALLIEQGIDEQSEAYRKLTDELGRLQDIQADIAQQGNILSNDEANYQGVMEGISGISGALSAATGATSLLVGENENLQKVMTKVQSVMAITIGLQQVSQALNKDSAFMLVTVRKAKELLAVAELKLAAAFGVSTVAAKALLATLTLGLSVAITGAIVLIDRLVAKNREAKKSQEEFTTAVAESAYKTIGEVERLSQAYTKLGDDIRAKEQFILDNRDAFDKLGAKIRSVADAENLLIKNKQSFIDAQIAKARAMAYTKINDEKINTLVKKEQEYKRMPDTVTDYRTVDAGVSSGIQLVEVENKEKKRLKGEIDRLKTEIKKGYDDIERENEESKKRYEESGVKTLDAMIDGSIQAIDSAINKLQDRLKDVTNRGDAKKILDEIKELEKRKEGILGKTSDKSDKDPFVEALEKRKRAYEEYLTWVNSDDESVRQSAKKQFASILKEGESYIAYLKNQRQQLLSLGNRTQEQNKNLASINKAIAEESRTTIMSEFEEAINSQLNSIDTVIDKIEAIKNARADIEEEDPLKRQKTDYLDKALKEVGDQARKETRVLYQEYASYYDKRMSLHAKYLNDIKLLEDAKKGANTEEEKSRYQSAIENRKKKYDKDLGDVDGYNEMLRLYGDFERKKQDIIDSYEEKRRVARQRDDKEMLESINEAEAKDISSLATEELAKSDAWTKLFGNLDELTAKEIGALVDEIEGRFAGLSKSFDPIDLAKIREKLNEARDIILNENPFRAVGESIKAVFSQSADDSKVSADNIKRNWKNLAKSTEKSFDFVRDAISSADFLKDAIGEVGETAINSLNSVAMASIAVATAIKTAEKASVVLAIIQAALVAVQAVINVVKQIAGNKDKKIQKQIEGHARAVEDLRRAYEDLDRTIGKALGGDKFRKQKDAIENLKAQQRQLQEMERRERSKKKSDDNKIQEYQDRQREAQRRQEEIIENMRLDLLGTDVKDAAQQLGDAFIDAFSRGEDAVKAFGKKTDEIVSNIMRKMLIKKLLEEPMGNIISKYAEKWVDNKGNFIGFDTVLSDADALGDALKGLAKGFGEKGAEVLKKISDISGISDNTTSLTGAIKGVTEETASVVAGQLNAIRMSQAEATDVLRLQLLHLSEIANNTKYCKHLESIDRKLSNIGGDTLRAKGLSA